MLVGSFPVKSREKGWLKTPQNTDCQTQVAVRMGYIFTAFKHPFLTS